MTKLFEFLSQFSEQHQLKERSTQVEMQIIIVTSHEMAKITTTVKKDLLTYSFSITVTSSGCVFALPPSSCTFMLIGGC